MDFNLIGTCWSLLPPVVAIALALKTKEVYSSLFIGIILGAALFSYSMGTGFEGFLSHLLNDTVGTGDNAKQYGLIHCLADPWNVGILVFLVVLGAIVSLMNKAGGSAAFGQWASKHVKTKRGAQIATILLGILIFIDDYFNCLTVGSVMRPITQRHGVTKEKLAYLIDSTAAPVCVISPISSWAAAVSGFVTGDENGLALFCKAIPYNFYALFTLLFMFAIVAINFDFKSMSKYDARWREWYERTNGGKIDEVSGTKLQLAEHGVGAGQPGKTGHRGTVADLVLPILMLIVFCTIGMVYSGGFFQPSNDNYHHFVDAFAASNASVGLVIGSLTALILSVAMFTVRKTLPFDEAMSSLIKGFEAMVPAILILTLAWTLKSMTDSLGAAAYVSDVVSSSAGHLQMLLPAIIFVVAALLAFATGTSWGTFGILIPICVAVFPAAAPLRVISISACMAGAVCGDHISPISDTTIMASAGASCKHVHHVSSQLPYALTVATVSFFTFIVAGFAQSLGFVAGIVVSWTTGLLLLGAALCFLKKHRRPTAQKSA
ncbi:Na+/H+ antiporter NhaC family protein [Hallella sp.]|uniref:Na+/H+ antiporter NhaC family protein n=1 Tax=Hallella sp. TaxID=2980186 RepID=UPI00307A204C